MHPNALKHIGSILLATLLCATVPVLTATPECSAHSAPCRVTTERMAVNPRATEITNS